MSTENPPNERWHVLITAVGSDRPGIVDDLSGWVYEAGGNIEDSRMALLGGEFAIVMLVSGGPQCRRKIDEGRAAFEKRSGLALFLRAGPAAPPSPPKPALPYSLTATALDHPGILHQVSTLLRSHFINIVDATTRTTPAPFTGTPTFHLEIEMTIPSDVSIVRLREELAELGKRENIDFDLSPLGG